MQQPSDRREFDGDSGAPLPDFSSASNIQLQTIGPAFGVVSKRSPDYLDLEQQTGGRGVMVTMFANTGVSYLLGIGSGGMYGLYTGSRQIPQMRMQLKFNAMFNFAGRYGSRFGNMLGVVAVLYSVYEGVADYVSNSWWIVT
jgi:import inner membrane translocase subunit TIM23